MGWLLFLWEWNWGMERAIVTAEISSVCDSHKVICMAWWPKGGRGSTFINPWDEMSHFLSPCEAKQHSGQREVRSSRNRCRQELSLSCSHHRCCASFLSVCTSQHLCAASDKHFQKERAVSFLPPALSLQRELLQILLYKRLKCRVFLTIISGRWHSLMGKPLDDNAQPQVHSNLRQQSCKRASVA